MSDAQSATYPVFGVEVEVVAIDISSLDRTVDIVVSSDDNYLSHGGGVSAALWNAAGPDLERWARDRRNASLALGDVVVSPAGDFPAGHILHAVTIDFDTNEALDFAGAVTLYGRVLDTAADLGARTIAMPLLGTGAAGLDARESAAGLRSALRERRFDPPTVESVTLAINPRYPDTFSLANRSIASHSATTPSVLELLERRAALPADQSERLRASWAEALATTEPSAAERVFDVVVSVVMATLHRGDSDQPPLQDDGNGLFDADLERIELPPDAAAAYRSGVLAKNRLWYQRDSTTADNLRRTLLRSAEDLTLVLVNRQPQNTEAVERVVGADLDPIHGLHQLLLTRMSKADRSALLDDLRSRGYKGSDSDCLFEFCLRCPPEDLLMDNFTVQQLRRYLNQRELRVPTEHDISTLSLAVLHDLGFRIEILPTRPGAILETVTAALAALDGLTEAEIRGRVNMVAVDLEACVFQFIRFIARIVLGIDADIWCQKHGVLEPGRTLRKATLGTLLATLDRLASDVAALGDAAPSWLSDGARCRIPHGYSELSGIETTLRTPLIPQSHNFPRP